jgi:hypothetical protein
MELPILLVHNRAADLKSAGRNCCTTAVQMVSGTLKNTPKRFSITLIPQQHTQNWIDS